MSTDILLDLLKRLTKDVRGKKVFVILDNLKMHHANPAKVWLAPARRRDQVFYLPSYGPGLNPDEMVNLDQQKSVRKQAPTRNKGHLKQAGISHLRRLQASPQRVARYFMRKSICDAA
ncbi:hypothetical protein WI58_15085 [Burkholderia cepacia]|nr:hypothetical protein WI47_21185 [Burkholderia cepacia]KVA51570.1 hypothetical protein WI48_25930 [Burkholderia cepacia]KVA70833.1 hypothetical protein WI49_35405 [Burkholderia cepacia]KVA78893.1 hypothetical protein WI51_27645 [Burkholderia cepacia]KVA78915.1 hypothetical protein WI52_25535 [Burkholderia cepacia]